jgi:hypothetical protein
MNAGNGMHALRLIDARFNDDNNDTDAGED